MIKQLRFAWRAFGRDLQAGELRVLALALIVAVASVTAVGFFTDRIGRAMELQAADILAADLRITAGRAIPAAISERAAADGLESATTLQFTSVVLTADDESQLVSVKAVSAGYPLRGQMQLAMLDSPGESAPLATPAPGTVWVDSQLIEILALQPQSVLTLGTSDFTVARRINHEPDRGENVFELAPRVMMNEADLAASGLVVEGSRARYALLLAGERNAINQLADWVADVYREDVNVQNVRAGNQRVNRALQRADTFLGLAAVVTVLLAGAAIALAVRQFALRQADASAVMRTLGASRGEVVGWLSWRLVILASLASLVGIAVGWLAQLVLAELLRDWFRLALPAPGLLPPVIGILTAFVTLAGFGLLPIIRAGRVPVMRVLQRDYSGLTPRVGLAVVAGLLASLVVVYLQSGDWLTTFILVGGVVAMLILFALFGRLMIKLVRATLGKRWRLSAAGLQRRAGSSIVQMAAFALGIMALLLISIVRVDVLQAWEQDTPEDAPNVFVVNLQQPQVAPFEDKLAALGIDHAGVNPLVRARLLATNGEKWLRDNNAENNHQRRHARFEYNLSWSDSLPAANELVEGEWWEPDTTEHLLSLEVEWAGHLGLEIGDTLTFKAAGQEVTGTVHNFRKVEWESFQVNFFIVGSEALLSSLPATWLTSMHIDGDFGTTTSGWLREFPGIVTLDVGAIITRVKGLMDKAALAIEYVFMFTLAAGVVVLLAAVQSSQGERIRESALLRALGASHQQIREAIVVEFLLLGAISGALAAAFATLTAWALSVYVLELPFHFNVWLWIIGILGGAIGISAAGYLATRKVLHTPPLIALRQQ
ncbi:MAG: FtsX-like permease family protein [Gammaproteobacteria bacterium]|nr:FtsX-like permease family protein [Gammaproteobacteria bacterium]